jgi:hypothetical protein
MRPTATSKTHVFPSVSLQTLISLRDQPGGNYALQFDPGGFRGLLTIHTPMGDVVVRFSHDNERAELALTIVKKPMLLPTAVIFEQTSQVLRNAASQAIGQSAATSVRSE